MSVLQDVGLAPHHPSMTDALIENGAADTIHEIISKMWKLHPLQINGAVMSRRISEFCC